MAELAVGIVGLAGLITVCESAFIRTHRFLKHVRKAEQQVNDLFRLITTLYGTLHGLERVVGDFNLGSVAAERYNTTISHCTDLLNSISRKLEKFHDEKDSSSSRLALSSRWKWPLSVKETEQMCKEVERYQNALGVSLIGEGLAIGIATRDVISNVKDDVSRIQEILNDQSKVRMSAEQNKLLLAVSSIEPWDQYRFNLKTRQKGTGIWFLDSPEFKDWLRIDNSTLWVFGIPGAGKSILASAAINSVLTKSGSTNNATAFFFCDYKRPETHTPEALLRSLVQQVARSSDKCFDRLQNLVSKHSRSSGADLANLSHGNLLRNLALEAEDLESLFAQMAAGLDQITILVDGLDECGDYVRSTVQTLKRISQCSPHVKTYLSSRNIPDIRSAFGYWPSISIAARSTDLLLFVGEQIKSRVERGDPKSLDLESESTKVEIMDALVNGAQGMFRWVTLQLDHICDLVGDHAIRKQLKDLPIGIDASYERLLHDFNKKPQTTRLIISHALKWVIANGRIPQGTLGEALGIDPALSLSPDKSAWLSDTRILQLCSSFVRSSDGYLEPAHFTVKEFLSSDKVWQDPQLQQYAVSATTDSRIFAITALNHMMQRELSEVCPDAEAWFERSSQHPFRDFLYRSNWRNWLRDSLIDPEVFDLTKHLFQPRSTNSLQSWMLDLSCFTNFTALRDDSDETRDEIFAQLHHNFARMSALHVACIYRLPTICSWLLSIGENSNIRSRCGTAFHCALLGQELLWLNCIEDPLESYGVNRMAGMHISDMRQILQALAEHEADVNRQHVFEGVHVSPLRLAIEYFLNSAELQPVESLLAAGALLDRESIQGLIDGLIDDPELLVFVEELIEAVGPSHVSPAGGELFQRLLQMLQSSRSSSNSQCGQHSDRDDMLSSIGFAMEANDAQAVVDIITRFGISSEWKNDDGNSLLHLAARARSSLVVPVLITQGIPPDAVNEENQTALHIALANADHESVQTLHKMTAACEILDKAGRTVWHYAAGLLDGNILCKSASRVDCLDTLQNFNGAVDLVDAMDDSGLTPLMIAVDRGYEEVFARLIKLGADEWRQNGRGQSLLQIAVAAGSYGLVKILLARHHSVAHLDSEGRNALHHALTASRPRSDILRMILEADKTQLLMGDAEGRSPLDHFFLVHLAADHNFDPRARHSFADDSLRVAVKLLCQESNETTAKEIFIRLVPIINRHWYLAQLFHGLAGRSFQVPDEGPLSTQLLALLNNLSAKQQNSEPADDVICGLISKLSVYTLRGIRTHRQQIITRAARLGRARICSAILDKFVDLDTQDEDIVGFTALQAICSSKALASLAFSVIELAGDLIQSSLTSQKQTLLHLSAETGSSEVVNELLDRKLNFDAPDLRSRTALHYAAMRRDQHTKRIVADLLAAGASPWIKDDMGFSAAHFAALAGNHEVLRLFEPEKACWQDTCTHTVHQFPVRDLTLLHLSAISNSVDCFRYLVDLDHSFDIERKAGWATLMNLVCLANATNIVRELTARRQDWAGMERPERSLWLAVRSNNSDTVRRLLAIGYSPFVYDRAICKTTPLQLAHNLGLFDLVRLLSTATTTRPIARTSQFSRLEACIKQGNLPQIRELLNQDCSVIAELGSCGCDLLLLSLAYHKLDVSLLLLSSGVRTNGVGCMMHLAGETALQKCARLDYRQVMFAILERSPWLLFVNYRVHPMFLAIYNHSHGCLTYLLEEYMKVSERAQHLDACTSIAEISRASNPSQISSEFSTMREKFTSVPMEGRCSVLESHDLRYIPLCLQEYPIDLAPGYKLKQVRIQTMLPIHAAVEARNYTAVKTLVRAGADIDRASQCWTALVLAIEVEDSSMIDLLLELGASPHTCDDTGISCAQELISNQLGDVHKLGVRQLSNSFAPPTDYQARSIALCFADGKRTAAFARHLQNVSDILQPKAGGYKQWSPETWHYLLHAGIDLSATNPTFGSILHRYWMNGEDLEDDNGSLLRRICRRLGPTLTKACANLQPESYFTPLYAAAIVNVITAWTPLPICA